MFANGSDNPKSHTKESKDNSSCFEQNGPLYESEEQVDDEILDTFEEKNPNSHE